MELQDNLDNILANINDARYSNVEDLEDQLNHLFNFDFQNMSNVILLNFKIFNDEQGFLAFLFEKRTVKDSLKTNMKKVVVKFLIKLVKRGNLVLTKNIISLCVS